MSGTKVTVVGGGSNQWAPMLIGDVANTPCLQDCHLVLYDIEPGNLPRVACYAEHVSRLKGIGLHTSHTTEAREALDGADFVIVCISTGGLESMGLDLAIAAEHGVCMPVGDTVGPSGICRSLRNVPVLVGLGRQMEQLCPDAWMLNVTNPLTVLTQAVAQETATKVVGLCHEVTNFKFLLSQLLDCGMLDIDVTVTGVNHLPVIVTMDANGSDGMAVLSELLAGKGLDDHLPLMEEIAKANYVGTGGSMKDPTAGGRWTKSTVVDMQAVNFEIFRKFGALPGASSDHTCEFFAGFVTERSAWGRRWGVGLTTIEERQDREKRYVAELDKKLASDEAPKWRSMEMVAPVIESLMTDEPSVLPLNIPNEGQCADLPAGAVVESMCVVNGSGIRGRDTVRAPAPLAQHLRRICASQELTLDAALDGDPEKVLGAMLLDPMAGRLDHDELMSLRDDLLAGTARWLPQFSRSG